MKSKNLAEQLTALLYAAKQGNTALGQTLVEGKADLNVMDQGPLPTFGTPTFRNFKLVAKLSNQVDFRAQWKKQVTKLQGSTKQGGDCNIVLQK
eukprot:g38485.t1